MYCPEIVISSGPLRHHLGDCTQQRQRALSAMKYTSHDGNLTGCISDYMPLRIISLLLCFVMW